jgi:hypothetical protein
VVGTRALAGGTAKTSDRHIERPMPSTRAKRFREPRPDAMGEVASIGVRLRLQLWDRMARESEAMAEHALGIGRAIPHEVLEQLDRALLALTRLPPYRRRAGASAGDSREEAMASAALRLPRYRRSLRCLWHTARSPRSLRPQHPNRSC